MTTQNAPADIRQIIDQYVTNERYKTISVDAGTDTLLKKGNMYLSGIPFSPPYLRIRLSVRQNGDGSFSICIGNNSRTPWIGGILAIVKSRIEFEKFFMGLCCQLIVHDSAVQSRSLNERAAEIVVSLAGPSHVSATRTLPRTESKRKLSFLESLTRAQCNVCGIVFRSFATDRVLVDGRCDACQLIQEATEVEQARRELDAEKQKATEQIRRTRELGFKGVCKRFARGEPIRVCTIAIWDDLSIANKLDRLMSGVAIAFASGGWLKNPPKTNPIGILAVTDKSIFCVQLGVYEEPGLRSALDPLDSYQMVHVPLKDVTATRRIKKGCTAIIETAGAVRFRFLLPDEYNSDADPLFEVLGEFDFKAISSEIELACNER